MPRFSNVLFFTGLSSTSRIVVDKRIGHVCTGQTPAEWIEENTISGIIDLGENTLSDQLQDSVSFSQPDVDLGTRWVNAFTAEELYHHCRTIHHLHAAIVAAVAFQKDTYFDSFNRATEESASVEGMAEWISEQLALFKQVTARSLLHNWFVLVPSEPMTHYVEFQHTPVHGLRTALALSSSLNRAINADSFFLDDSTRPQGPVFFAVRLEDLPVTVLDDEYQEALLRWVGDKLNLPLDYTLHKVAEAIDQSSEVSGKWASMLIDKTQ